MKASALSIGKLWTSSLGALGVLSAVSCASTPAPEPADMAVWSGFDDCFQRTVSVPSADAERMARTCAGDSAAGDPSRSGIVRANAYFNAASAYNALAASGAPNALCPESAACSQTALSLLEQSRASQQDTQIRPTGNTAQDAMNERFVLRRKLEQSRALQGLAESGDPNASCGTKAACLTTASGLLGPIDVEPALASDDQDAAHLACDVLNVRWQVNNGLGRAQEHLYVDDLRRIVQACPSYAASASDRLAEISFDRAELVRASLAGQADSAPSVDAALGAITDYRAALNVDRFKLPAYRGMGAVYSALATLDPAGARTYFESATEALGNAVALGAATEPAGARASDLSQLGNGLMDLARLTGRPGTAERQDLYQRAATALQDAVNLAPTPARYLSLGEAYGATGQYPQSIAAYRSAIGGLTGPDKAEASLALAGVLDLSGDSEGALQALEQASQGAGSPDIQFEIGRRKFADGQLSQALVALRPAVGSLSGNDAAEAHYMISVAEMALRTPGWEQRAFDHAEGAIRIDSRTPEYIRQDCLANIAKGGKAVKEGTSLSRCPDLDTPDSRLLRGMYFLKQAQSLDVSAYNLASQTRWRSILGSAENAFTSGQDALQADPDSGKAIWFDDLQAEVDLSEKLDQGLTVVKRCNREITINPGDPAWTKLDAFFGHYGVLKCS